MRSRILVSLLCLTLLSCVSAAAHAAANAALGVRVEGDTVVFRFVPAQWRMAVSGKTSRWMRLRDLRIREVTVAGGWNQWSTEAWPLHARKSGWELRTPLSAVADHDTCFFKFVVNDEWWVQPPPDAPNQVNAGIGDTTMNLFFVRPSSH